MAPSSGALACLCRPPCEPLHPALCPHPSLQAYCWPPMPPCEPLQPCLMPPPLSSGLFLAPQTTGEALKGGRLVAEVMHREGYKVIPVSTTTVVGRSWESVLLGCPMLWTWGWSELGHGVDSYCGHSHSFQHMGGNRHMWKPNHTLTKLRHHAPHAQGPGMPRTLSMICAIEMGSRARMESFCKGIQRLSPVGSYIEPVPGEYLLCASTCWGSVILACMRLLSPYLVHDGHGLACPCALLHRAPQPVPGV